MNILAIFIHFKESKDDTKNDNFYRVVKFEAVFVHTKYTIDDLQTKNSMRSVSAINSFAMKSIGI